MRGQRHVDTYFCVSSAFAHQTDARNGVSAKKKSKTHNLSVLSGFGGLGGCFGCENESRRPRTTGQSGTKVAQLLVPYGTRGVFRLGGLAGAGKVPIRPPRGAS